MMSNLRVELLSVLLSFALLSFGTTVESGCDANSCARNASLVSLFQRPGSVARKTAIAQAGGVARTYPDRQASDGTVGIPVEQDLASEAHLDGPVQMRGENDIPISVMASSQNEKPFDTDGFMPFHKVLGKGPQFDSSFFDGGTYLNEAVESQNEDGSLTNVLKDQAESVKNVYEQIARNAGIEFPDYAQFQNCELGAVTCCWVADRQAGDNNGECEEPYDTSCSNADPADNTDVCYVNLKDARHSNGVGGGFAVFPNDDEGSVHCQGFAWGESETSPQNTFKGNSLFYVSMYDHLWQRGYVRNVPGSPMCGCIEKMPVVSRADCTEVSVDKTEDGQPQIDYNTCKGIDQKKRRKNNDLEAFYRRLQHEGQRTAEDLDKIQQRLVGDGKCQGAIAELVGNIN